MNQVIATKCETVFFLYVLPVGFSVIRSFSNYIYSPLSGQRKQIIKQYKNSMKWFDSIRFVSIDRLYTLYIYLFVCLYDRIRIQPHLIAV